MAHALALLVSLAACAGGAHAAGAAGAKRPNIVWIMADDLDNDWKDDRMSYMPTLRTEFRDAGAFFVNHVAAQPVCGPSRSSLLLGRFPHNTGYVVNDDLDSVAAFVARQNNSVGAWLKAAGYYTAFHGKYVNSCQKHVPSGWSHYGAFLQTYDFYNASCYAWEEDTMAGKIEPADTIKVMTGVHQADFLGNFTVESARRAIAADKVRRSSPYRVFGLVGLWCLICRSGRRE